MLIDFVPRKQLHARLVEGWSPVPDHDYRPGDWALLLQNDGAMRSLADAEAIIGEIDRPAPLRIGTPKPRSTWRPISFEKRREIIRRLLLGERHSTIKAVVHVSYSSISKIRNSEEFARRSTTERAGV